MKEIWLNTVRRTLKNYLKYKTLVDDEDYDKLIPYKWNIQEGNYARAFVDGKYITMHIVIMGRRKGFEIDHIDGDGLNNQKSNLRFVTDTQNQMNGKVRRNSSSKFKGVSWMGRLKKWQASITIDGHLTYLGIFTNEKAAAITYNQYALKHFGEYAKLNQI